MRLVDTRRHHDTQIRHLDRDHLPGRWQDRQTGTARKGRQHRTRPAEPGGRDRNRLPKPGSEVPPEQADASRSAGPGTIHNGAQHRQPSPPPQTVTVDGPVATVVASPRVASGAQRDAVAMSHGCREAHRGHGGVCRNCAAWRATGGGCEDRICNPDAYGILTETLFCAELSVFRLAIKNK